jgi:uncharacterized cupin superfamily protein
MRRHPNVINLDETETFKPPTPGPAPFAAVAKRVGAAAGGRALGASFYTVPAGAMALPMHAHFANEEGIFVVRGRGTLRLGQERIPVREGDWIACLVGEENAHQLLADQGEELAYLVVSTMNPVEVVTYPDSGKLMAAVGMAAGGMRKIFRTADGNVGYWDGEGEKR